ncbi:MAG: tetratricopeptide repeat protein, partial [Ignavibacteriaceae bacterium]
MKTLKSLIFFLILIYAATTFGQEPNFKEGNNFYRAAMNYYQAKKYDSLLVNMQKALALRPNHPTMLYNLAVSYVFNNQYEKAFKILHKMAKMGLFYQVGKDEDFETLLNNDEFKIILNELKENLLPTNNSSVQLEYPEKDLITESVVFDPETGTFYLSSIHKRKIVKIDKNGATGDFKSEMQDSLWSVFGMKIDA